MWPYCNHAVLGSCPVCGGGDPVPDEPAIVDPLTNGLSSDPEKRIGQLTEALEQARRELEEKRKTLG